MKIKIACIAFIVFAFFQTSALAEEGSDNTATEGDNNNTLTIGTVSYNPPYVTQGSNNDIYGYDIDMMRALCQFMQKNCVFKIMKADQLIQAVVDGKIDIALNTLTISTHRLQLVNFSMPYSLSRFRFLTNSNNPDESKRPFSMSLMDHKKIGVLEGSIFDESAASLGIESATIIPYNNMSQLVEDLYKNKINYILVHNPVALYWDANTPGALSTIGPAFSLGMGVGIVVNKQNIPLLQSINKALVEYQDSPYYENNYDKYLKTF